MTNNLCPWNLPLHSPFALGLLCAAFGQAPAQVVFHESRSPAVIDRAVIVPPERFNTRFIEQLSRQFLSEVGAGAPLARVTFATSERSLMRTMVHGTPASNTYENTMAMINGLGLPEVPIARLIAVQGVALLSYRDKNGYDEHIVAGAADPTHFAIQGTDFQLLHFRLTEPGPALQPDDYSLTMFFKALPDVSISACVALTERMRDLTKVPQLSVEVRRDAWFIGAFIFPAVFPFAKDLNPPTALEYMVRPHTACGFSHRGKIRCSGTNFEQ